MTPSAKTPCGDSDSEKKARGYSASSQGRLLAKVSLRAVDTAEGSLGEKQQ